MLPVSRLVLLSMMPSSVSDDLNAKTSSLAYFFVISSTGEPAPWEDEFECKLFSPPIGGVGPSNEVGFLGRFSLTAVVILFVRTGSWLPHSGSSATFINTDNVTFRVPIGLNAEHNVVTRCCGKDCCVEPLSKTFERVLRYTSALCHGRRRVICLFDFETALLEEPQASADVTHIAHSLSECEKGSGFVAAEMFLGGLYFSEVFSWRSFIPNKL